MANGTKSKTTGIQIISPVFRDGAPIPVQYSCNGQNVSPPLNFISPPADAKSLALILHDPDAPSGDFVHWVMWNIPTSTETIAANSVPVGAAQGLNGAGKSGYMGPCPPSGTHHYIFEVYALDVSLNLPASTTRDQLKAAMQGHTIDQNTLTGTFSSQ